MSKKKLQIAKPKTIEDLLDEFQIKPCRVILERATFLRISLGCSAKSSGGFIHSTTVNQKDDEKMLNLKRKSRDSTEAEDDTHYPRKKPKIEIKNKTAKSKALVRTTSKPMPCKSVDIGEVILCKMRGFPEWPAFVTGFDRNLACIQFFGDQTTHKAAPKNFYKFRDSFQLMALHLHTKKNPLYIKAVREAETVLGVPSHASVLNNI